MKSYHMITCVCGSQKNTQAHSYREQIGGCQQELGAKWIKVVKGTNSAVVQSGAL